MVSSLPFLRAPCSLLLVAVVAVVRGQYDYVSECPTDNGFFADALQCDRYYECKDGEVSEHFCPDGLVFDESSTSYAKCGFPFSIDCTGRSDLQPAQPTQGCPRQHGYFAHQDTSVCNKFNFCVDGVPNTITCAGGLIFDPSKGQCDYADQTKRPGCTSDELFTFQCPQTSSPHEHSRHPDPDDCSVFFLCIEGKARRNSCSPGTVFNPDSLSCEAQDKVEGPCQFFFNETYLESLSTPAPVLTPSIQAGRISSQEGRRRPSRPQQVNRQPIGNFASQQRQPEPQPQEVIPQQLLDLQNFGQNQQDDFSSFGQNAPTFGQNTPSRARVPVGRPRRPQAPVENNNFVAPRVQGEDREAFFNNLRTSVRQRDRLEQTTSARPFTRPPRRRPTSQEDTIDQSRPDPSTATGFGRRRQPGRRRPATAEPSVDTNVNLLDQVKAELSRREQFSQSQNLGPSALDSLLTQSSQPTSSRNPGLRRGPVSRGGVGLQTSSNEDRRPQVQAVGGRGRLQVLDNTRPPLQPQPEDEIQDEFEATLNSFRQRNRG